MASQNGSTQLLARLLDRHDQNNQKAVPKKRRIRRCKTAPMGGEYHPLEARAMNSIPRTELIFGRIPPSLFKVAVFLLIYLGIGTICFYNVRSHIEGKKTNGIVDSLYFCVVTMTTVGYGDLVPDTVLVKLLACSFVFVGMAIIGLILSKAADYLVEKQEGLLVRALHARQKKGESHMIREMEINKAKYKCYLITTILVLLVFTGTLFLSLVEGKDLVDAFYCVCCTITTLGYGDQSFSTLGGRVFAVFWILASTICLAQFYLYLAELNTETRQQELVKWVLNRRVTNQDLEAADLDNDGVVDMAEFALYKLKEMGKITQEDISMVIEEFEELDVDESGTLSPSDIALAQSGPQGRINVNY